MSALDIIHSFTKLGVRLWEEDGQLRYRAPKGLVTDEYRDRLRQNKDGILAALRQEAAADAVIEPDWSRRFEPFPLTDVQTAYLTGRRPAFDYGNSACQLYLELELPPVDERTINLAWRRVVERHDMLRATFDVDGFQTVLKEVPDLPIPVLDLRSTDEEQRTAAIATLRERMDHYRYEPHGWPLFGLSVSQHPQATRLHLSIDYLIADFQSIQLVLGELERRCLDPDYEPAQLALGFRDYVAWSKKLKESVQYRIDKQYWWDRIDDLQPAPDLPIIAGTETVPARFRRFEGVLGVEATKDLFAIAAKEQLTTSSVLLSVFVDVLKRWSRRPAFTLNLTIANRHQAHPGIDDVVGDFTTILPLAVETALPSSDFSARARLLQARLMEDLQHTRCTGIEILRELAQRRGRAQAMLPIVFTSTLSQAIGGAQPGRGLGDSQFVYGRSQTPQVWLDCQVALHRDELILIWDVREQIFLHDVAADMFESMMRELRRLAADPNAWHRTGSLDLPIEQLRRHERSNHTHAPMPAGMLHDPIVAQCRSNPDAIAIISPDRSLTYAELLRRANAVAQALRARGVVSEEIVPIIMEKGWEQVVAALGILLAGAAYLPLDLHQPPKRREEISSEARARVVLTQSRLALTHSPGCDVVDVDCLGETSAYVEGSNSPTNLAYVIYTSGTTGRPKGVMINHRSALNTIADINHRFAVDYRDRIIGLAHLGFDLSVYDIFGILAVGATLVLPLPSGLADPSHWCDLIERYKVTLWNSVPAQMQMLAQYMEYSRDTDAESLRLALLSGDWIPLSLPDRMRNLLPSLEVVSLGGATEASIWSISYPIKSIDPSWRSVPYGMPLTNQRFHVLNDRFEPCPDGVIGELFIAGEGLATGYLHQPERTLERFDIHPSTHERLYRTGDLGRYMPDGNIEFVGREDRQIKLNGYRIELEEIEAVLSGFPDVASANVLIDRQGGGAGQIVAFISPHRLRRPGSVLGLAEAIAKEPSIAMNLDGLVAGSDRIDDAAALSAAAHLSSKMRTDRWTLTDAIEAFEAARYRKLLQRIVVGLVSRGLVVADGSGGYTMLRAVDHDEAAMAWDAAERMLANSGYPVMMFDYLRDCAQRLPVFLRGEADPVQLLFPRGDTALSEAAFRENPVSAYANEIIARGVAKIAGLWTKDRPLRILEVGAGTASTTVEVLRHLADCGVEYVFTDISKFYLDLAGESLSKHRGLTFALLDLNRDYRDQGFTPNSFDIVIAGDVFHATRDIDGSIERIRQLLRPSGWLLFTEMTRDHFAFTISFELMLPQTSGDDDFADLRRGQLQTFLTLEQWRATLAKHGTTVPAVFPDPGSPLGSIGMYTFAVQVKTDRCALDLADIAGYLAERLPPYMLPAQLQVIDDLPLSANGKVDHAVLASWIDVGRSLEANYDDGDQSPLEAEIAGIWQDILGVAAPPDRKVSLYDLGGDSLILSRLVGRMHEQLPIARSVQFDRLLRQCMDTPTITALAAFLEDLSDAVPVVTNSESSSPLVPLRTSRDKPSIVLVHDATGGLERHDLLISKLAPHFDVHGMLLPPDIRQEIESSSESLERIAERYAQALLAPPDKRWHVVGCGLGASLTVEMCSVMAAAGRAPASLSVLGGEHRGYTISDRLLGEFLFALQFRVDPSKLGMASHPICRVVTTELDRGNLNMPEGTVARARTEDIVGIERALHRSEEKRLDILIRAFQQQSPHGDWASMRARLDQYCTLLQILSRHQSGVYAGGDILLIMPTKHEGLPCAPNWSEADHWRQICLADVNVVDIETDSLANADEAVADQIATCIANWAL